MANEALQLGIPRVPHKVRFSDFAPDLDPITPGIALDMSNLYPSTKGFRSYPSLARFSGNDLPEEALGAYSGVLGDTVELLVGTSEALFRLVSGDFVDSGLTPSAITGRWRFDTYAGEIIAVNGVDAPFKFDGATFGNLGGTPPVSSLVCATQNALFLIHANSSDWSASLNSALWTPSIATQTVTGTLRRGAGNITAAHSFRGGAIALYKRKHVSLGQFEGPPFYWNFGAGGISDQVGAPGHEAVANLGDVHYFVGPDDFYRFDGFSLERVPNNLKEWFFETLNQTLDHRICARWDQKRSLIFWHFPSNQANPETALDAWICLNLRTGKWTGDVNATQVDIPIFSAFKTGQLNYGVLVAEYPLYGDVDYEYGDLRSRTVDQTAAIQSSNHGLFLYNGQPGTGFVTTHDWGDRESLYQITKIQPRFSIAPSTATVEILEQKHKAGTTPTAGPSASMNSKGEFDIINTAKLQRVKISANEEFEIVGCDAAIEYAGES